jgi:Methyltransferase domain
MSSVPPFEEVMFLTRKVSGACALQDPEAQALYDCCIQVPEGGIVVETGCQIGRSSSLIAQVGRAIGYHSIHIDPYHTVPPGVASPSVEYMQSWVAMMRNIGGEHDHEFTFLCMRTEQAKWLLSKVGAIDMAFIDGDHERPGVDIDLKLVAEWIKRGGFLTAHDYGRDSLPTVKAAIDGWMDHRWEQLAGAETLGVWRRK